MLDDAQQTRWPAMIQDLVQHYTVLWHESDTGLPWALSCSERSHSFARARLARELANRIRVGLPGHYADRMHSGLIHI